MKNNYTNIKSGWYKIGDKSMYFRSKWEANYSLYLNFLKKNNEIADWGFEVDTFWFEKIKRGVRSYLPDFKIYNTDGTIEYHEIKGYMDSKSKTKIKRMAKYYPNIKLILVDSKMYNSIIKQLNFVINFY